MADRNGTAVAKIFRRQVSVRIVRVKKLWQKVQKILGNSPCDLKLDNLLHMQLILIHPSRLKYIKIIFSEFFIQHYIQYICHKSSKIKRNQS